MTHYRRIPNSHGGGFQTNVNGLGFEGRTSLIEALNRHELIEVVGETIWIDEEIVGRYKEKHAFYRDFVERFGFDWKKRISKKYLPDAVIINDKRKIVFVIEKKYQERSGSTDEKLQTCDFKRKIYQTLLKGTGYEVEYFYLLNSWFKRPEYEDVKKYIKTVGCDYFIDSIELKSFGFL